MKVQFAQQRVSVSVIRHDIVYILCCIVDYQLAHYNGVYSHEQGTVQILHPQIKKSQRMKYALVIVHCKLAARYL